MYKSEIRPSQIERLKNKVKKSGYQKYLSRIRITKCRAFEDQKIQFDFPVTALIGPNGGGKTTILGTCAILYKMIAPRQFFARNKQLDREMHDWSISYEAIDRNITKNDIVRRTAKFTKEKWSRDALDREVVFWGVSRTLPAVERNSLSRFTDKKVTFQPDEMLTLGENASKNISAILGKDVSKFHVIDADRYGNVQLLLGKTIDDKNYSEFHFGAGESSIIKMVMGIENAAEQSLILIEEIENGLHPLAVLRLIDYLVEVAERKKLQIVFTTHSEYAIRSLPAEAIWASINGKAIQGKLDIHSLRSINGEVNSELVIYLEDEFAKEWVKAILRSNKSVALDAIDLYSMGGDGTAVSVNKMHNEDPGTDVVSICILDGDSQQIDNKKEKVFRLYGEAPEQYIYDEILENLEVCSAKLSVRLMHAYEESKTVEEVIRSVKQSNYDHHLLFSQVGEKLGFINENVVREAFLTTWCELNPQKVADFINQIREWVPMM